MPLGHWLLTQARNAVVFCSDNLLGFEQINIRPNEGFRLPLDRKEMFISRPRRVVQCGRWSANIRKGIQLVRATPGTNTVRVGELDRLRTLAQPRLMLAADGLASRVSYERESTGNRNVVLGSVLRGNL